jgi:cysteinyl-tRNA synthetase
VLGEKYANLFLEDIRALNDNIEGTIFPRASGYISAEIAMIQTLEEKGYTYRTSHGVYFDTSHFPDYGKLGDIDIAGLKQGARVASDPEKRSPTDFLLWKSDPAIGWDSPWGTGFPGWHIECSAMIRATLGQQIDIHTGGIEHIPVHHNNEIAQSESATGKKPLARFWMHRAHLKLEGGKMAKSEGNVVYLSDIVERGFHPLALRYLLLTAHYRTSASFTWEALEAAQKTFANLVATRLLLTDTGAKPSAAWRRKFLARINDDLDTPGALALMWDMVRGAKLPGDVLLATLLDFDHVLGLNLAEPDDAAKKLAQADMRTPVVEKDLPEKISTFVQERNEARSKKDWARADELRVLIEGEGYSIEDAETGPKLYRL